ncbi:hypothetical protein BB560_006497, partial [Smittium megazygosporum]
AKQILGTEKYIAYQRFLFLARADPAFLGYSFHSKLVAENTPKVQKAILLLHPHDSDCHLLNLITFMIKAEIKELSKTSLILRDNSLSSSLIRFFCERPQITDFLKSILSPTFLQIQELEAKSFLKDSQSTDVLKVNSSPKQKSTNAPLNLSNSNIKQPYLNNTPASPKKSLNSFRSVKSFTGTNNIRKQSNEFSEDAILNNQNLYLSLLQIVASLLNRIESSIDSFPTGLREISCAIKDAASQRFPSLSEKSICSLVGGFFFLRLINPAIMIPEKIFTDSTASKFSSSRKLLTLVAKTLQNLANNNDSPKNRSSVLEASSSSSNSLIESLGKKNHSKVIRILQKLSTPNFEALTSTQKPQTLGSSIAGLSAPISPFIPVSPILSTTSTKSIPPSLSSPLSVLSSSHSVSECSVSSNLKFGGHKMSNSTRHTNSKIPNQRLHASSLESRSNFRYGEIPYSSKYDESSENTTRTCSDSKSNIKPQSIDFINPEIKTALKHANQLSNETQFQSKPPTKKTTDTIKNTVFFTKNDINTNPSLSKHDPELLFNFGQSKAELEATHSNTLENTEGQNNSAFAENDSNIDNLSLLPSNDIQKVPGTPISAKTKFGTPSEMQSNTAKSVERKSSQDNLSYKNSEQSDKKSDFFANTFFSNSQHPNISIDYKSLAILHSLILETANYWENMSQNGLSMELCLNILDLPPLQNSIVENALFSIELLPYDPYILQADGFL